MTREKSRSVQSPLILERRMEAEFCDRTRNANYVSGSAARSGSLRGSAITEIDSPEV